MAIPKFTRDLAIIQKLDDLPNANDGLSAQELKAKFDEGVLALQKWINEQLVAAITAQQIPFTPSTAIDADNIDAAIRNVQSQIAGAVAGTIVNGSVTKEKLAETLLDRVYGGRPMVSMDTPTASDNTAADLPLGQLWLRPAFTVENKTNHNWQTMGCTVQTAGQVTTVTGSGSSVLATVTQGLSGIGNVGDRVFVLFSIADRHSEITSLTVSVNNGAEQDAMNGGVYVAMLAGDTMTVKLSANWPTTSVANGSYQIVNFAVVNVSAIERQVPLAVPIRDWAAYLSSLLPLTVYQSEKALYQQTADGQWTELQSRELTRGSLLYGDETGRAAELPEPTGDNPYLHFANGKPQWKTMPDVSLMPMLASGSYVGDGAKTRTLELPVTPKVLFISPQGNGSTTAANINYSPCVIVQGGAVYQSSSCFAWLSGRTLGFKNPNTSASGTSGVNVNGWTFHWAALY